MKPYIAWWRQEVNIWSNVINISSDYILGQKIVLNCILYCILPWWTTITFFMSNSVFVVTSVQFIEVTCLFHAFYKRFLKAHIVHQLKKMSLLRYGRKIEKELRWVFSVQILFTIFTHTPICVTLLRKNFMINSFGTTSVYSPLILLHCLCFVNRRNW